MNTPFQGSNTTGNNCDRLVGADSVGEWLLPPPQYMELQQLKMTAIPLSPVVVGWLGGCEGQGNLSLAWVFGSRGGYASSRVAEAEN